MDAFASLGPEQSGSRLAEQDSINNFVKMAQGEALQAKAEQERLQAEQARREMAAISQLKTPDGMGGPGAGGSLADLPAYYGTELMKMGAPAAGAKLLGEAAKIRFDEAGAAERKAHETQRQVDTVTQGLEHVGRLASTIRSPEDWQVAGMAAAQAGLPNPFKGPYNPARLPQIQAWALAEKDRQQLRLNAAENASQAAKRGADIQYAKKRLEQFEAEAVERKRHNEAMEKIGGSRDGRGGKPVSSPTDREVSAARRLVREAIPGISGETEDALAEAIASEAEARIVSTPGLHIDAARRQALAAALKNGDVQVEQGVVQRLTGELAGKPNVTLNFAGKTADDPITDAPGLKHIPGRWYQFPRGVMQYRADGRLYPKGE